MIIEDLFLISSPIEKVWEFFLDLPRVSMCIPGDVKANWVDKQTITCTLGVKVGPITAKFDGHVHLMELEPPCHAIVRIEGKDKMTGSMINAICTGALSATEPNITKVSYHVDLIIRGRLGQFGQGVIREVAKQITQDFATCVQKRLTAQDAQSASTYMTQQHSSSIVSITISVFIKTILAKPRSLWTSFISRLRAIWP